MRCDTVFNSGKQEPGKSRADAGFVSLIVAVSVISGGLIYSMSGNDPYWRVLNGESMPAPSYDSRPDLDAVMTAMLPKVANPDTAAASPGQPAPAAKLNQVMTGEVVDTVRRPEPELAQVPALEDGRGEIALAMAGLAPSVASAPAAMTGPLALSTEEFARPASLAPVRDRLADPFGAPMADLALTPFAAPQTPAQPRIAGTEMTEEALALQQGDRIDVQRRLALAGFDPRGLDGTFGQNTRSALAGFQEAWGYPATGYLEDAVYAELNERTEAAYQAMRRRAASQPSAAPVLASAQPAERPGANGGKCARGANGRIIERQSLACDLAGMAEQFVSMGRSSLESEEATGDAAAVLNPATPKPGNDH